MHLLKDFQSNHEGEARAVLTFIFTPMNQPTNHEKQSLLATGKWTEEDFEETAEEHSCPYRSDIMNDDTPCCRCSKWQQQECAMDI